MKKPSRFLLRALRHLLLVMSLSLAAGCETGTETPRNIVEDPLVATDSLPNTVSAPTETPSTSSTPELPETLSTPETPAAFPLGQALIGRWAEQGVEDHQVSFSADGVLSRFTGDVKTTEVSFAFTSEDTVELEGGGQKLRLNLEQDQLTITYPASLTLVFDRVR